MSILSRRRFLAQTTMAAGATTLMPRWMSAVETATADDKLRGDSIVTLGKTGIKTSLLGMGTGFRGTGRSSNQLRLGFAGFERLIRHGIDRGLRYIDTADQYGTHIFVRETLKNIDRDGIFIQTKTRALHPEVAKVDIERFRQELGVDTIDSLLMHCMTKGSWPTDMRPVMDVLQEAKEKGRVRAVGISNHGWEALKASLECDWVDVQLARINAFGTSMDGKPEDVVGLLKKAQAMDRGVIGMKICGGGRKTGAEDRLKSLGYVLGTGCVDAFTIGFETPEQIDQVMDQIEQVAANLV